MNLTDFEFEIFCHSCGSSQDKNVKGVWRGADRVQIALIPCKSCQTENHLRNQMDLRRHAFVCPLDVSNIEVVKLLQYLRDQDLRVDVYPEPASLSKQLQYANERKSRFAIILGQSELASGLVTVKNLSTGNQEAMPASEICEHITYAID